MVFFAILQKYDFSSKSQCLNGFAFRGIELFAILKKCDFSSKSQVAFTADLWGMVARMAFSTCCGAWAMCRLFVWRLLSFLVKMFGVLVLFCIFALAH